MAAERQPRYNETSKLLLLMTVDGPGCLLKGHGCCRQCRLKGKELGAGCPAFHNLFHVFWCENKRGKFKGSTNSIQRYQSPNFCRKSRPADTAWLLQLYSKFGRSSCCLAFKVRLMSQASVPDTKHQIVHFCREQAVFWRSAFPSDCFIR